MGERPSSHLLRLIAVDLVGVALVLVGALALAGIDLIDAGPTGAWVLIGAGVAITTAAAIGFVRGAARGQRGG